MSTSDKVKNISKSSHSISTLVGAIYCCVFS